MVLALKPTVRKNGFTYTQVCRGARSCVYAQHVTPIVTYYEVFLIKVSQECYIDGKLIETRERFPGNEDFGLTAWTYRSLKEAEEKFEKLEGGEHD